MIMNVSDEIMELSRIFEANGEKLYIVGGYVRNFISNSYCCEHDDVDLCSAARPDKVKKILSVAGFEIDDSRKIYGTVIIRGLKRYEYTTFRRENFNLNGQHNPTGVEFIKDIREDALRRDFTINAVYYDIQESVFVDPVGGISDIKQKIIRTPINASQSFKTDGERILRMIRFSYSLGYEIEQKTLIAAYNNGAVLKNLSCHRKRQELDKMLVCDTFYPQKRESRYAHSKCMIMIGQLNLWQYILPAMDNIQKSFIKDEKGEELYSHIINTLSVCKPEVRLACLLHDVGKLTTKERVNSFNFSSDWAGIIIEANLGIDGLYYPKKTIQEIKKIVLSLDYDRRGMLPAIFVKRFIRNNYDVFDKICDLKDAIALENTNYTKKSKIAARWKKIYRKMQKQKTPLTIAELKISGGQIINLVPSFKKEYTTEILNHLLDYCLIHPSKNNELDLCSKAQKIILKNPQKYLK